MKWSRWWVGMWVVNLIVLVVTAATLPFWTWFTLALALFAIPEAIGLMREDAYPPLTQVVARYVPSWAWFPAMYAALGGIAAHWLGFAHPWRLAALFGLMGWLTDHFTTTYDPREGG